MAEKFDYEIDNFIKNFSDKRNKCIALYGTGRMTATLLSKLSGFKIVGLLDRDQSIVGTLKYGVPVLCKEEALEKADLIVINTSETYWNTIYNRIREWQIPVYFLNGQLASATEIKSDECNEYWEVDIEKFKSQIDEYDVISFDIFDTLIMRKILTPIDLFHIVEQRLDLYYKEKTDFTEYRKKAASLLEEPSLDAIYEKIKNLSGKTTNTLEHWKLEELKTEEDFIAPRKSMVRLCKELMKKKRVYFVSDMYYSSDILQKLLLKAGLDVSRDRIIVSCEHFGTKENGRLWEYYRDKVLLINPNNVSSKEIRKAVHIGDNKVSDIDKPREYGIDSYYIMDPLEMLCHSSIGEIYSITDTLYGSVVLGHVMEKLFNDPFALNATAGKIVFENEKVAGYCILGSLIHQFLTWLISVAINEGVQQLVFFAREGYLLVPLYKYYIKLLNNAVFPSALYLEISRSAVFVAGAVTEQDIYNIAKFPFIGTVTEFMNKRFRVLLSKKDDRDVFELQQDEKAFREVLDQNMSFIMTEVMQERRAYLHYLKSLDLSNEMATVDSQFYGSTQYYLGGILGKKLKGYYMCANTDESNTYLQRNSMLGCFQGKGSNKAKDTYVHKMAPFLEAYFTAPYGMLEYIGQNGQMYYAENMSNQNNFDVRMDMQEGIKEFLADMTKIFGVTDSTEDDRAWADELFGAFMNNGFLPTNKMKNSFYFDNNILDKTEMPIWE